MHFIKPRSSLLSLKTKFFLQKPTSILPFLPQDLNLCSADVKRVLCTEPEEQRAEEAPCNERGKCNSLACDSGVFKRLYMESTAFQEVCCCP